MREHELKTWPDYYAHLVDGSKTFEYRRDDRGFKIGDVLYLREWEPTFERYTGREVRRRVTYIMGVSKDFVVMALADRAASVDAGERPQEMMNRRGRHHWWDRCSVLREALFGSCSCVDGCEYCDRRRIIIENWIVEFVEPRLAERWQSGSNDATASLAQPRRFVNSFSLNVGEDGEVETVASLSPAAPPKAETPTAKEPHTLDALGSEPMTWERAARILGESLAGVGPNGYGTFTAQQWLEWARQQTRLSPAALRSLSAQWRKEITDRGGSGCGCYGKNEMQRKCANELDTLITGASK